MTRPQRNGDRSHWPRGGAHDRANSEHSLQYPDTLIDSGTFGGLLSHHQTATKETDDAFTY